MKKIKSIIKKGKKLRTNFIKCEQCEKLYHLNQYKC